MTLDVLAPLDPPSAFLAARIETLRASFSLGPTLDVASGQGRHTLFALEAGAEVLAVDRNAEALESLRLRAEAAGSADALTTRVCDLETATLPPLPAAAFGCVLVFRYLHRPLMPWIAERLAPGGWLFYETFTTAQRSLGWGPSRDAFLLEPEELTGLFPGLEIEAFEQGLTDEARPAETARLLAHRPL